MKKKLLAALLAVSFVVTACGPTATETTQAETTAAATEAQTTASAAEAETTAAAAEAETTDAVTEAETDPVVLIDDFVGVWQTGSNEDTSYLVICEDLTWKLLPADDLEGVEEFGGTALCAEDSVGLYHGDELWNTVYFGAEENTLYSEMDYTYVLVSKDYNEIGN